MTSGPAVISCLHLPPAGSQPAALSHHTHLTLLCLFSTWPFSLLSPPRQFLTFLPMAWPLLGWLLCGQWMNRTISSFIRLQQTVASPHFLPGFLGQLSAPETATLNTRPGAGPTFLLCGCSFYSKQQSHPLLLLAFWIQSLFLLKITHSMPRLVFAGVMHLTRHCCPLLGSPTAAGLREVSATGDNL